MLYFIHFWYYVMFLQILLDMLVLVIIKLYNFHVLYFLELHIIFTLCYILCLQFYLMLLNAILHKLKYINS